MVSEDEGICGLCGQPGADKVAKWTGGAIYWPGEERPEGDMVHLDCEKEECRRAYSQLSQPQRDRVIDDARRYGMNPTPQRLPEILNHRYRDFAMTATPSATLPSLQNKPFPQMPPCKASAWASLAPSAKCSFPGE